MQMQKKTMMKVVNIASHVVPFKIARGPGESPRTYELRPGEVVDLEAGYCVRMDHAQGLQPSVIEKLTGGMVVPESDPRAADYVAAAAAAMERAAADVRERQERRGRRSE